MLAKVAAILAGPRTRIYAESHAEAWRFVVRYSDDDVDLTARPADQRTRDTPEDAVMAGIAWVDAARALMGTPEDAA